jgi:AraC-like DNA-binding protein
MFLGLLIDTNRPAPAVRPQQPLTHALAVIVGRCTDPALTPAVVAQEARLSLRQLQRLFRERGTTVGREIRRARVEQALTLLRDRQYDALSIDQVAQFVGFSNGSSLARAMAAEGHASPTRAARDIGHGNERQPVSLDRAA